MKLPVQRLTPILPLASPALVHFADTVMVRVSEPAFAVTEPIWDRPCPPRVSMSVDGVPVGGDERRAELAHVAHARGGGARCFGQADGHGLYLDVGDSQRLVAAFRPVDSGLGQRGGQPGFRGIVWVDHVDARHLAVRPYDVLRTYQSRYAEYVGPSKEPPVAAFNVMEPPVRPWRPVPTTGLARRPMLRTELPSAS